MNWWSTLLDYMFGHDDVDADTYSFEGGAVAVLEENAPAAESAPWWQPEGQKITEPARITRSEPQPVDAAVTAAVESLLNSPDVDLPHLPQIPQKVLTLLRQENVNLKEVADVISQDQVSAAAVLRRANAASLGTRVQVTALCTALTRLGVRDLRSLMITQSVRHLTVTVGQGKSRGERLWRESLAAGVVASAYDACFSVCMEDAFLIGLLHDIGKVMVLRACHDAEITTRGRVSDSLFDYLSQEYHERLGQALAQHWKLPEEIAQMTGTHHQPVGEDGFGAVRAILQLTDASVSLLGYSKQEPFDLLQMPAARYLDAGENSRFLETLSTLPPAVERAVQSL